MKQEDYRDLLVELRTQNVEILRRLTDYDKIVVPRSEYQVTVQELRNHHLHNQQAIEAVESQIRGIIWKVGGGLASLQVVTSLVLFLLTKG